MNHLARRAVLPLVLVSAVAMQAAPAAAHGTCKATASPPAPALLTVFYMGAYDCTESHGNLYVDVCLQKSLSPLSGWETVDCTSGHAQGATHLHAYETTTDACVVGYYRAVMEGSNGDWTHHHYDYSPVVACASAK